MVKNRIRELAVTKKKKKGGRGKQTKQNETTQRKKNMKPGT